MSADAAHMSADAAHMTLSADLRGL